VWCEYLQKIFSSSEIQGFANNLKMAKSASSNDPSGFFSMPGGSSLGRCNRRLLILTPAPSMIAFDP